MFLNNHSRVHNLNENPLTHNRWRVLCPCGLACHLPFLGLGIQGQSPTVARESQRQEQEPTSHVACGMGMSNSKIVLTDVPGRTRAGPQKIWAHRTVSRRRHWVGSPCLPRTPCGWLVEVESPTDPLIQRYEPVWIPTLKTTVISGVINLSRQDLRMQIVTKGLFYHSSRCPKAHPHFQMG